MIRYLLKNKEMGVYAGRLLGQTIWSVWSAKLGAALPCSYPTFTEEEADEVERRLNVPIERIEIHTDFDTRFVPDYVVDQTCGTST